MKSALPLALFLLLPFVAFGGGGTAYQALNVVGARSKAHLQNVIEIKGRNGTPQPATWMVLLNDPMARGGVRELEVARGNIVSERTPLKVPGSETGKVMNLTRLNLDSEGAFAVAEEEARVAKVRYHGADYALRADLVSGTPIWVLHLLDKDQKSIASVTIAADTGKVLSKTFQGRETKGSWSAGGGLKGRLIRFSDAMGNSFRKAGNRLHDFWDGGQ